MRDDIACKNESILPNCGLSAENVSVGKKLVLIDAISPTNGKKASASGYNRLILRSLEALLDAVRAAEHGRVVHTYSIELLLAILFDRSDGDRMPYDDFIRHACGIDVSMKRKSSRAEAAREAWRGIARGVGVPCENDTLDWADLASVAAGSAARSQFCTALA